MHLCPLLTDSRSFEEREAIEKYNMISSQTALGESVKHLHFGKTVLHDEPSSIGCSA